MKNLLILLPLAFLLFLASCDEDDPVSPVNDLNAMINTDKGFDFTISEGNNSRKVSGQNFIKDQKILRINDTSIFLLSLDCKDDLNRIWAGFQPQSRIESPYWKLIEEGEYNVDTKSPVYYTAENSIRFQPYVNHFQTGDTISQHFTGVIYLRRNLDIKNKNYSMIFEVDVTGEDGKKIRGAIWDKDFEWE